MSLAISLFVYQVSTYLHISIHNICEISSVSTVSLLAIFGLLGYEEVSTCLVYSLAIPLALIYVVQLQGRILWIFLEMLFSTFRFDVDMFVGLVSILRYFNLPSIICVYSINNSTLLELKFLKYLNKYNENYSIEVFTDFHVLSTILACSRTNLCIYGSAKLPCTWRHCRSSSSQFLGKISFVFLCLYSFILL